MDNPTSASAVSAIALKGPYTPTPPTAVMGTPDAASYLNLSAASLNKMRCMGGGPVFIRLGRKIGYMRPDLDKWLAARRATNTSDAAARLPAKLTIAA